MTDQQQLLPAGSGTDGTGTAWKLVAVRDGSCTSTTSGITSTGSTGTACTATTCTSGNAWSTNAFSWDDGTAFAAVVQQDDEVQDLEEEDGGAAGLPWLAEEEGEAQEGEAGEEKLPEAAAVAAGEKPPRPLLCPSSPTPPKGTVPPAVLPDPGVHAGVHGGLPTSWRLDDPLQSLSPQDEVVVLSSSTSRGRKQYSWSPLGSGCTAGAGTGGGGGGGTARQAGQLYLGSGGIWGSGRVTDAPPPGGRSVTAAETEGWADWSPCTAPCTADQLRELYLGLTAACTAAQEDSLPPTPPQPQPQQAGRPRCPSSPSLLSPGGSNLQSPAPRRSPPPSSPAPHSQCPRPTPSPSPPPHLHLPSFHLPPGHYPQDLSSPHLGYLPDLSYMPASLSYPPASLSYLPASLSYIPSLGFSYAPPLGYAPPHPYHPHGAAAAPPPSGPGALASAASAPAPGGGTPPPSPSPGSAPLLDRRLHAALLSSLSNSNPNPNPQQQLGSNSNPNRPTAAKRQPSPSDTALAFLPASSLQAQARAQGAPEGGGGAAAAAAAASCAPGRSCQWEDLSAGVKAKVLQVVAGCGPYIQLHHFDVGVRHWLLQLSTQFGEAQGINGLQAIASATNLEGVRNMKAFITTRLIDFHEQLIWVQDPQRYALSRLSQEQYKMVQELVEGGTASVLQWSHFDPKVLDTIRGFGDSDYVRMRLLRLTSKELASVRNVPAYLYTVLSKRGRTARQAAAAKAAAELMLVTNCFQPPPATAAAAPPPPAAAQPAPPPPAGANRLNRPTAVRPRSDQLPDLANCRDGFGSNHPTAAQQLPLGSFSYLAPSGQQLSNRQGQIQIPSDLGIQIQKAAAGCRMTAEQQRRQLMAAASGGGGGGGSGGGGGGGGLLAAPCWPDIAQAAAAASALQQYQQQYAKNR